MGRDIKTIISLLVLVILPVITTGCDHGILLTPVSKPTHTVATIPAAPEDTAAEPEPSLPSTLAPSPDEIDSSTGQYRNYYLGLVKGPEVEGGTGCYDTQNEFIVLINNINAVNPTFSELEYFLQSDKTDEFSYQLSVLTGGFYYGQAEDKIDLGHIKEIIDGMIRPDPPRICADFAERLHNEAEMAGIRCGFVIIDNLDHALNVFETTDNGFVFIDDTGGSNDRQPYTIPLPDSIMFGESTSWDKIAYIEDGKPYGLIDLASAPIFGLDYSGYENWLSTKSFLESLEAQYDKLAAGRTVVPQDTYDQLQKILAQEKTLATELGGFWGSLGTVDSHYVTWDGDWRGRN